MKMQRFAYVFAIIVVTLFSVGAFGAASFPTSAKNWDALEAWDADGTAKDYAITVPAASPCTYEMTYKADSTKTFTICTAAAGAGTCLTVTIGTEASPTVSAGTAYVNENTGLITFNVAQAGSTYYLKFTSLGSYVKIENVNTVYDEVEAIENYLLGIVPGDATFNSLYVAEDLYTNSIKTYSSSDLTIDNDSLDKDIVLKVNDGGVDTDLVHLDGDVSRVGILDSTPSYTLDVGGTLRATGAATLDSTLLVSSTTEFNGNVTMDVAGGATIDNDTGALTIDNDAQDVDIILKVNDGGVDTDLVHLDGDVSRVGILDSTPSYTLDVGGTLRATGAATLDSTLLVSSTTEFNGNVTMDVAGGATIDNDTGALTIDNDAQDVDIILKVNDGGVDTDLLHLDGDVSRVGILDSTPSYTLDVNGTLRATGAATLDSTLYVSSDATFLNDVYTDTIRNSTGDLIIDNDASEKGIYFKINDTLNNDLTAIYIDPDVLGSGGPCVGIFNTSPQYALDVTGSIKSSSTVYGSTISLATGACFMTESESYPALTLLKTAQASTQEKILKTGISDETVGTLSFGNLSSTDSTFVPALIGLENGTTASLSLVGECEVGDETGAGPLVRIIGQSIPNSGDWLTATPSALSTRPVLGIYNYSTQVAMVDKSGNLGIGPDTTPDYLCDVQGTLHADGAATFDSTVYTAGDATVGGTFYADTTQNETAGTLTIENTASDQDIEFWCLDGATRKRLFYLDGSAGYARFPYLLLAENILQINNDIQFGSGAHVANLDTGETLSFTNNADATLMTIAPNDATGYLQFTPANDATAFAVFDSGAPTTDGNFYVQESGTFFADDDATIRGDLRVQGEAGAAIQTITPADATVFGEYLPDGTVVREVNSSGVEVSGLKRVAHFTGATGWSTSVTFYDLAYFEAAADDDLSVFFRIDAPYGASVTIESVSMVVWTEATDDYFMDCRVCDGTRQKINVPASSLYLNEDDKCNGTTDWETITWLTPCKVPVTYSNGGATIYVYHNVETDSSASPTSMYFKDAWITYHTELP